MMVNQKLISIVVPVYNVEKYLPQCLDSLCKQTYKNLEIIVVDDESPDQSGAIADAYASKDLRIKVFHINNRGAAGARNVALDACNGDYIMFVDSDDWIETKAIEIMIDNLELNNCDIVQCQYIDEYVNTSINHICDVESAIYTDENYIEQMIYKWEYVLLWNKIYKKECIGDLRLTENHCIDDEFFTYQVIMRTKRISIINDYLYHYRQRESGAMRSQEKEKRRLNDQLDFVTTRFKPLCIKYPNLKYKLREHLLEVLMHVLRNSKLYPDIHKKTKVSLFKYGFVALYDKNYSFKTKKSIIAYLFKPRKAFVKDITYSNGDGLILYP